MRLKSLELIGFKSFVDRTVIQFEPGITGVVGPNGSGKSNVVDAMRWVMGEQSAKHLRGGEMQDVIFAGSEKRRPTGMASVFLTFDNSDGRAPAEYSHYSEITVGRRLYRSGESEYFINKTACRLRDITDLFLGTGTGTKAYSIVEQGQIGRIVSSRPEERRLLIEEAAGISKFKNRRETAERKMAATQGNLLRLRDIIAELERQLSSLRRQAKKAEKYRNLEQELRRVELAFAAHQWLGIQSALSLAESDLRREKEAEVVASAGLAEREAEIETGRSSLLDLERAVALAQEKTYALQNAIHLFEAKIEHRKQEIKEAEIRRAKARSEAEELSVRKAQWRDDLNSLNGTIVTADLAAAEAREEGDSFAEQTEKLRGDYDALAERIGLLQANIVSAAETISSLQSGVEHVEREEGLIRASLAQDLDARDDVATELNKVRREIAADRSRLDGMRQVSMKLEEERSALEETLARHRQALQDTEAMLEIEKEQLQLADSRLRSLDELAHNFAGYQSGVKAIMQSRDASDGGLDCLAGVQGLLAEHMEVDPRYETAVGALLGERVQGVLVATAETAVAAVDYLNGAELGRGTFIPTSRPPSIDSRPAPALPGVLGKLESFVTFQEPYAIVGKMIFQDVCLVENLSVAYRCWALDRSFTYVTLNGDVLDRTGIISGGGADGQSEGILARQREREQLRPEVERLRVSTKRLAEAQRSQQARVKDIAHRLEQLAKDSHDEEINFSQLTQRLTHKGEELARLQKLQTELHEKLDKHNQAIARLAAERSAAIESLRETRDTRARDEKTLQELREMGESLGRERAKVADELTRRRTILAAHEERALGADREIERLVVSIADAECARQRHLAEGIECDIMVQASQRSIEILRAQLQVAVKNAEAAAINQRELQQKYNDLKNVIQEQEESLRQLRAAHEKSVSAKHEADLAVAQHRERIGFLYRDIMGKYNVSLEERADSLVPDDFDESAFSEKLADLRHKMQRFGGVNTDSIEEYAELEQRYQFLTGQAEDLENSVAALQRAIHKINRVSRERFRKTFSQINEKFVKLFPRMFCGGKAELRLTDEDNLLESGVEIIAQPPGKKLQNVGLLSGGEKALTAVVLIFAMFLVRPSPFCLLDEVDAPLDDVNIDRFNEMIREMTKYAQFILITHNKRTMTLGDCLYGVTMEEPGVSRIVSVRLNRADDDVTAGSSDTAAA